MNALRAGAFTVHADGSVEAAGESLEANEVQISTQARPGFAAAETGGYTLVLDTTLTPELIAAGRAREVVHRIQTMRKDAGFDVEDRIVIRYAADHDLAAVFQEHADYIKKETLSVALDSNRGDGEDGHAWSGEIDGAAVKLRVARLNGAS